MVASWGYSDQLLNAIQDEREDIQAVVSDLFAAMESIVTEYDDQAIKIAKRIEGTAFFPGGVGLWRGLRKNGPMPEYFPNHPVMMLAHNFDAELLFNGSVHRGIEKMDDGTWKGLLKYLAIAGLPHERCFFTNVFVGLKPGRKSRGPYEGSEEHKKQCREFLKYQLRRTRPCLVAVLGTPTLEQFNMIECPCPHVSLQHPSYASNFGWESEKAQTIIRENGGKLADALKKRGDDAQTPTSRLLGTACASRS
jgi:hypothetical protein